jgi:SAM-dependent methyltransferase
MEFKTRHTYDFVKRFLPYDCRRILEVGCGTGELAAQLAQGGYAVIAIDSDREAVAAARRLGVDARVVTWPDFDERHFDAVLFTHSLHHIHPLHEAVRRAAESLVEGGVIIVEEFAFESADEKTLRWFASAIRILEAASLLVEDDPLLAKTETLNAWQQGHGHELHTAAEIGAKLEELFGDVLKEQTSYYFRYLAASIVAPEKRDAILQALAKQEEMLSTDGSIVALGRRFVAERAR